MSFVVLLLQLLALAVGPALADDATAILKVKAQVEGAEVWVDGALLGKTPLTKYLPPGPHQLRVVADRFDPFVRRVELVADRTLEVNAALTPGKGTLEFSATVPGARVFLDGTDRGPLPIRLPAPSPGPHTWRVEAPKHEPVEGTIDFVAGRNYLLPVELPSSAGVVAIESSPAGATVWLDGEEVGVTPLKLTGVAPGKHGVRVEKEGRAAVLRTIDTSDGSRGELKASLPESGGVVAIATGDEAARVYLDDVLVGEGENVRVGPIEKGRRKLRVLVGDREAVDTISVPSRGSLSLRVAGDAIVERKPLYLRWGFWAVTGGVLAAGGATAGVVAVVNQPPLPPMGDEVVQLP
ncbi:MAG: PEGA domain-containing protein [Myxococcota bacterium]